MEQPNQSITNIPVEPQIDTQPSPVPPPHVNSQYRAQTPTAYHGGPFLSNTAVVKIEQILMFTYFAVAALLLFRFVLSLFGANRESGFVNFIFQLTAPVMLPFLGMFGRAPGVGNARLEFEVVIALLVYALIFFGLTKLIRILFR